LGYRSLYARPGTIYVPDVPVNLWNELYNGAYPIKGSVALARGTYNIQTLHVTNNATLSCQGDTGIDPVNGSGVEIISDNITVDSGAKISADGEGFWHNTGPGKSWDAGDCSGGAGYGGRGGDGRDSAGGPTYGTIYEPTALGSGGGGGASGRGGGAIKLNVTNTLTVNGTITADGTRGIGNYPGGSGGSVWLICDTLAGYGSITANGGRGANTTYPGGGGGGRIHTSRITWAFTGGVDASGGTGRNNGEYGTIFDNNPFLEWTGEPNYESDGLDPEWGNLATSFTYRVKYTHVYDLAPTGVYVHVLEDGLDIAGSPFLMTQDGGGPNYVDGFTYNYTTTLPEGNYTYYFDAPVPNCGPPIGAGSSEEIGPSVIEYAATNVRTGTTYGTIQAALAPGAFLVGDTIEVRSGFIHNEQVTIPSGVSVVGDSQSKDPTLTTITSDTAPVISFSPVCSESALKYLTIRYAGENANRTIAGREYFVDIGNGSSGVTIDTCLVGRDGYVSGWSGDSRYLSTKKYNDGGIRIGDNSNDIAITNSKIRYLTGPGIVVEPGSNDNISIEGNHIYRNILPWDVRPGNYYYAPGIALRTTARASITSNEIYSNNAGIGSRNLTGTTGIEGTVYIEGNVIHHNNAAGIALNAQSSSYFKSADIVRNNIYSNGGGKRMGGMRIRYAQDLKIRENHIHHNRHGGIYFDRIYNTEIDKNNLYGNTRGIRISYAYDFKLRQNHIKNNGARNYADVNLDRVYDFEVYNNKFYPFRNWVWLGYGGTTAPEGQSFFYKNIIEANGSNRHGRNRGLIVYRTANTVFSGNIIRNGSRYGVQFREGYGPIDFRHNKIYGNGYAGVRVDHAFSGNMFKNVIVNNSRSGIRFVNNVSGDLEIYNNTFADNGRAGVRFDGGLTTSSYSLFHNVFAFNTKAGYDYGGTTWPPKDRWDWVDKYQNFFFWNYGSLAGGIYNQEREQFVNAQWNGPGGTGTDDITMEVAHWNYDQGAWDFLSNPPYSLAPLDSTGALELADGYPAGAYSEYLGRSASYTVADPTDLAAPGDPYVEPPAIEPPGIPPVPGVPSPFPG
jgi:parallel beta-helix repeat protein